MTDQAILLTITVRIEHFSRESQIFSGGSYFDIFPGKSRISKFSVLNCYLAVNCSNPPKCPMLAFFKRGSTTAPGSQTLNH